MGNTSSSQHISKQCPYCQGSGKSSNMTCMLCEGRGKIYTENLTYVKPKCRACGGSGYIVQGVSKCVDCQGSGL